MTQELSIMTELKNSKALCEMLLKTPHYTKMGQEGVFAIVETAHSLGIDPRQALGGGLYYVKGKVEMSARMMNSLIRSKGHSIMRDAKSDDTVCILHGRRADNGDTWSEQFSIQDAQKAGLANNPVWKNFTRDMLFARALSRLARQLFPDVIGNVYVEGELSLDANIKVVPLVEALPIEEAFLSGDQVHEIVNHANADANRIAKINKHFGVTKLCEIPACEFEKIIKILTSKPKEEVAS